MSGRIIDPLSQADQHLDARAGVPSRRDLALRQQQGERRQEQHGLEIQTEAGTILARLAKKLRFVGDVVSLAMVGDVAEVTIAAAEPDTGYFTPPGPVAIDTAAVTNLASQQCGARYLGMVPHDVTSVEVNVRVTTAAATITWAECAIASANSATGGSLTLIEALNESASFNSTGNKTVTFPIAVAAGTFLYFLFGSQATTPFQLRATLADELGVGLVRLASTTRPSTMAAPTAFSTSSAVTAAAWCIARWS